MLCHYWRGKQRLTIPPWIWDYSSCVFFRFDTICPKKEPLPHRICSAWFFKIPWWGGSWDAFHQGHIGCFWHSHIQADIVGWPFRLRCVPCIDMHRGLRLHMFVPLPYWFQCDHKSIIPDQNYPVKEMAEGRHCQCATICLEASGSDLATRVGNQLYELGRAGSIKIPSFPDFTPHLEGLKAGAITERTQPFKVTAVRGNNLMVLDSFAKRWLTTESTQERAQAIIESHNAEYNVEGDFVLVDRTQCPNLPWC